MKAAYAQYDISNRLRQMVLEAHREVLYEKIKKRIEHMEGEKLDKIAEILTPEK